MIFYIVFVQAYADGYCMDGICFYKARNIAVTVIAVFMGVEIFLYKKYSHRAYMAFLSRLIL